MEAVLELMFAAQMRGTGRRVSLYISSARVRLPPKYQDTSTGNLICEHRTKLGTVDAMRQNPYNGVMALGHSNGTVTMWTPNMTTPVVKMLCHRATVTALAFDLTGHYMATAGVDCQIHVWDARKLGEKVPAMHTPSPAPHPACDW